MLAQPAPGALKPLPRPRRIDADGLGDRLSGLDPLMEVAFRESIPEAKDRRQAVFLSSHILSQVEALGYRVGILRDESSSTRARWASSATSALTGWGRSCRPSRDEGTDSLDDDSEPLAQSASSPAAALDHLANLVVQPRVHVPVLSP